MFDWQMRDTTPWFMALVVLLVGCQVDRDSGPTSADLIVARNAFHRFDIMDACQGGGKLNFCTTEEVTAIEKVTASDPGVVEVIAHAELPEELAITNAAFAIHGIGVGSTRLTVEARFDDGSLRTTEKIIAVATPDAMKVGVGCSNPDVTDRSLFRPGAESMLGVTLQREQKELAGVVVGALRGDGLVPLVGSLQRTAYQLTAPDEPGPISLSSGTLSDFAMSLRVFSPDEAEIVSLDSRLAKPIRLTRDNPSALSARAEVGGQVPCQELSLNAQTLSPEICLGPNDETEWSEATPGNMRIKPLASGSCDLKVGIVGATKTFDFSISYEVKD